MRKLITLLVFVSISMFAQSPANVNGYSVPNSGVGLTVYIGPGSNSVSGSVVNWAGGYVSITRNATTFGYLDNGSGNIATNTTGTPNGDCPIFETDADFFQVTKVRDKRVSICGAGGSGGGGNPTFNNIQSGTNTSATMTCGTGCSVTETGTGTINANQVNGANLALNLPYTATNGSGQIVAATTPMQSVTPGLGLSANNSQTTITSNGTINGEQVNTVGAGGATLCDHFNNRAAAFPGRVISGQNDPDTSSFSSIQDCGAVDLANASNTFLFGGGGVGSIRTNVGWTVADRQIIIGENVGKGGTSPSANTGTNWIASSLFPTGVSGGTGLTGTKVTGTTITFTLSNGSPGIQLRPGDIFMFAPALGDATEYHIANCTGGVGAGCVNTNSPWYALNSGGTVTVNTKETITSSPSGTVVELLHPIWNLGDPSISAAGGSAQVAQLKVGFINADSAGGNNGQAIGVGAGIACQENCGATDVYVRNAIKGFQIYGAHRSTWKNLNVAYNASCLTPGVGVPTTVPFEIAPFLAVVDGLTIFADPCTPTQMALGLVHITNIPVSSLGNGGLEMKHVHCEMGGTTSTGDCFLLDATSGSYDLHDNSGCPSGNACKNLYHVASTFVGTLFTHGDLCNNGTGNYMQDDVNSNTIACSGATLTGTGYYKIAVDGTAETNMGSSLTKGWLVNSSGRTYYSGGKAIITIGPSGVTLGGSSSGSAGIAVAAAAGAPCTWLLPTSSPTVGQVLQAAAPSGGNCQLSWTSAGAGFSNPMTTSGDVIYGAAAGAATRLAGPTSPSNVTQIFTSTNVSGVAQAPAWAPGGVPVDLQSGTTYTIAATDRASLVGLTNTTTSTAITVPQAGTSGFATNFPFVMCNGGTVVATATPTTSTVNSNATLKLVPIVSGNNPECAFWWSDNTNYYAAEILPTDSNGLLQAKGFPALTGDVTNTAGTLATTVGKVNGGSFPASANVVGTNSSSQIIQSTGHQIEVPLNCADSSGSGTAQTCTTAPTFTPASPDCVIYTTSTANSGTGLTVNINSLGAKSVAIPGASGWTTTLVSSPASIQASKPIVLCYDGTNWDAMQNGVVAVPVVNTVVDTSSPVTVSATLTAEYHFNENATAGTAMTYNLPTAAAGKQFCISNAYNGSASNTGVLTIATSASGQFIIFTDGTLSATGGNVTSGGAAADAACVVGVDSTHWMLYTQRGTWTKH